MPQPQPRQQSRLNDIQMLQRQIMIKKLQELQRQQQVQELGDARQHNYINQQYALNKQISAEQFPPLINGTPISDALQRFMMGNINLMHPGALPVVQGFSNGVGFPQNQGQTLGSMGLVSPQLDVSLYGTPVPGMGNNMGRYSQLLGASQGSEHTFEKGNNNQQDEPITQSSIYTNSLGTYNCDASSNHIGMQEGALVSGGDFQEKNMFGQVPAQVLHRNFQQMNTNQRSSSPMEVGGRPEQTSWHGQFPGKAANLGPSQDICSLDPLEQKILFNTDDNSWDASFGSSCNISSEFLKNTSENTDHTSAFPSLQSGSWSALMQSAVAETSSSDAGIQEEWSGLSFQNPELSNDNRSSKFIESGKQHPDWVENAVSALNSKPDPNFKNLSMASSFPGFQQPGIQFSLKQKDELHLDTSRESNQHHSPKNNKQWLDCNSLQKQTNEVNQHSERLSSLQSAWPDPNYEHSKSNVYQESIPMYTKGTQAGDISGIEQVKSGNVNNNHPFSESTKLLYGNDTDGSVEDARRGYARNNQYHRSSSPQICNNTYNGASRTYEKQQCIERENSNDSYHSNASQRSFSGHELKQNAWQHKSDSSHFADSSQRPSDQVMYQQIPQGSRSYESGYAEQFRYNVSSGDLDSAKRNLLGDQKNLTEHASSRNHENSPAFFDTSVNQDTNVTAQTSQHMLELLYKVDKSKDYRPVVHGGSRDSSPFSEMPQAGSPDTFATHSYNKPPSQTFGLRLSPPSQQTPASNCFDSSHSSPKMAHSGDTVSLGPSFVRNELQSHINQDIPSNSYSQQISVLEDNSAIQPVITSGTSQYAGYPMLWKNAPVQRNLSNADPRKGPPSPELNKNDFAASIAPHALHYETTYKGQNESSRSAMSSEGLGFHGEQAPKEAYSQLDSSGTLGPVPQKGKSAYGQVAKGYSETDNLDPGPAIPNLNRQAVFNQSQNISDLEVFGRSLEPSHISSQDYARLQQVHLANANTGHQLYGNSSGIQDAVTNGLVSMSQANFHSNGERKLQNLSSETRESKSVKTLPQPLLQDANQETVTFGQYSSPGASEAEKSQVSMQMAPSWFKHYGALRNGQMLPMFDPRAAHQFSTGNILEKLRMGGPGAGQESSVSPTTTDNNLVALKSFNTSYVLPPDVLVQNPEIIRPKKRKAFEILPWHKEISLCLQELHNARLSDLEWSEATNRRIEKVIDDVATIEDSTSLRPKKRLASTTQLMQQLFRPPPAVIFGGDAILNCETVAYFAARLALGHSCCLKSSSHKLCNVSDKSLEKLRTPKQIGDQEYVKVVEDFLARSKKLEASFLILEKSASIADIRVEAQELEKFSMINHFAKFHSRGPAAAAEASTSSGTRRMYLQRYVRPVPMPRTVPEEAQCLSL
ncbi:hypothetical protein DCAR_0729234 [Daucus carota subsp. sativus]|uniref:Uncharacterized protein n=1 Tax=Daucus carota subsp. sativus TaxID=79200 RepID=A0AAF0XL52_DAUCS|nr:PREDICTED: uncharacterized protein LOC108195859 isoform X2 [Daucus carota subsp. sativus]WOH09775.1 hypothetical protein DCAR_0729234 [Daucus carota subsp. sativus]